MTSLVVFLATERDGVLPTRALNLRMTSLDSGFLVPPPADLRRIIEFLMFFCVLAETWFDANAPYIAYRRAVEIDWAVIYLLKPYFL